MNISEEALKQEIQRLELVESNEVMDIYMAGARRALKWVMEGCKPPSEADLLYLPKVH